MLSHCTKKRQGYPIPEASNLHRKSGNQPKPTTEKYSVGWFDGLIGETPLYPENTEYWTGYCLGNREFWCKKKGIELSDKF